MGRIVAIDYGQKRVGIAVSDPLKIIANGLTTVGSGEIFNFLSDYLAKEPVERFVVGWPKDMHNHDSDSTRFIEPFVRGLKKRFPSVPVELADERFTSVLAHRTLLDGGARKKQRQDKSIIDKISATIILQTYLESIYNENKQY